MTTDLVIRSLNSKKNIFTDRFGHLSYPDQNPAEASFLQNHHPGQVFITYGSLAPGGIHHSFIKNIPGQWQQASVLGRLENRGWVADLGYSGYLPPTVETAEAIEVHVLFAPDMGNHWQRLDEFMGEGYIRQLAQFTGTNGETNAGYLYAVRVDIY
jgi:gamma-glutamylcyclotransferase (GGCT)/AIG2-like uncharacterized protein YtfP